MNEPLRAVVADDSAVYRAVLARCLRSIGGVEIVGQAVNGTEAVECVRRYSPDVLTLDLNMPVLDGLGALRAMREAGLKCEVIVVSSETRSGAASTLEALRLGAVDFVTKPSEDNATLSAEALAHELRRLFAAVRLRCERRRRIDVGRRTPQKLAAACPSANAAEAGSGAMPALPKMAIRSTPELVVVGTSTGGPQALPVLLGGIPADFELPILIVQHMPPLFTASLAESLDRKCSIRVVEAHNGQRIASGFAYIAPGGRHLKVKRAFDGSARLMVSDDLPENHCKPSVDVLFRSVAEEFGGRALAAILTGMGNDGVAGLRRLKESGAMVIAQDEASCTVFGMPQEAIRAGVVDSVLPLDRIAPTILGSLRANAK